MQFVDLCYVKFQAGNGGDGALAWRREAHVAKGGPYGGNGGNGGSIYLVGDENVHNLFHLRHTKIIKAEHGQNGANKGMHGKNAPDLYIKVPCGTVVTDAETGEKLFDLIYHQQTQLICQGGKGGKGNLFFKSAQNPAPTIYERGDFGKALHLKLEMQSIADVGLLGFPNAGKSTFLTQFSNAHPKIAPYPFTTLKPVLGLVKHHDQSLVFADIPGIIENAAQGSGLGLDFLKHLNRCSVLLHLIDSQHELGIIRAYQIINEEIQQYSPALSSKPQIIIINKADLGVDPNIIEQLIALAHQQVFVISAQNKTNTESLFDHIFEVTNNYKLQLAKQQEVEINQFNDPHATRVVSDTVLVTKSDHGYVVNHPILEYWVHKLPQNTLGNRLRLKQKMATWQLERALIAAGAKKGDTISCYGLVWAFQTIDNYESE